MAHDIVIRGGSIVDGTGAESFVGDIAIDGDTITAVGTVDGTGTEEIDASGLTVTPGFIDIHTHLDAQIGWDPEMTPISWHGVTTALIGNCGLTFAPVKPGDVDTLAEMMEAVEDIPKHAILEGLPWTWEHYGEYLDHIETLNPSLNVAGLIGHSAVRYYVMGDRSFAEDPTEAELKQMSEIVADAMKAGAVGFSTNRFEPHKAPDGRPIPGTFAKLDELQEIAKEVGPRDGLMQVVGDGNEVIRGLADEGSRVLFSFGISGDEGSGKIGADHLEYLASEGRDITATIQIRGSGLMFGLQGLLPHRGTTWDDLREKDLEGRLAALDDEAYVGKLIAEAKEAGDRTLPWDKVFFMGNGESPIHTQPASENIAAIAKAAGEHWSETFIRIARETKGRGLCIWRMFGGSVPELAHLYKSPHLVPGLGDVGAHVSQFTDAGWASFILAHWVRDSGTLSMEDAIRRMTSASARVIGLTDRGELKPGMKADINVFNPDTVNELQPTIVHDFPGGAPRYIQKSRGYKATLVNGKINILDDKPTGARAGRVLRHQSQQDLVAAE